MKKILVRAGALSVAAVLLTLLIRLLNVDLRLARLIYAGGSWPGIDRHPWDVIYRYGEIPAFILAGTALAVLLAGTFCKPFVPCRKQALFLVLLLALGPGLIVNVLLKDNLGRARPHETVEFGGRYQFTQAWQMGDAGRNSSFPSGHASSAFYLMAPWFILRGRRRALALTFLGGGLVYGMLVGTARMLQGGHFISDVMWAGILVYLSGEFLAMLFKLDDSYGVEAAPG